jgi:hypothetical protein
MFSGVLLNTIFPSTYMSNWALFLLISVVCIGWFALESYSAKGFGKLSKYTWSVFMVGCIVFGFCLAGASVITLAQATFTEFVIQFFLFFAFLIYPALAIFKKGFKHEPSHSIIIVIFVLLGIIILLLSTAIVQKAFGVM